jgi:hypothetical protein
MKHYAAYISDFILQKWFWETYILDSFLSCYSQLYDDCFSFQVYLMELIVTN